MLFRSGNQPRGLGLMLGVPVGERAIGDVVAALLAERLVALSAGKDVLRLLPPLTISDTEIELGIERLRKAWNQTT